MMDALPPGAPELPADLRQIIERIVGQVIVETLPPVLQALRAEFAAELATINASNDVRAETMQAARDATTAEVARITGQIAKVIELPRVIARTQAEHRATIDQRTDRLERVVQALRDKPPELPLAEVYTPSRSYRTGSCVLYLRGLWQSQRATTAVPGEDPDWRLVIDGIASITVQRTAPDVATLRIELVSGFVYAVPLDLVPGPIGETGPPGLPGPGGRGIAGVKIVRPGVVQLIFDDDELSEPIDVAAFHYLGTFKPGTDYAAGDVVRLGYSLWICVTATGSVPSHTNPDWTLFLPGVEPAGVGGGGLGIDLPQLDRRYLRLEGGTLTGTIAFNGNSLGLHWPGQGPAVYVAPSGRLVLRRDATDAPIVIEGGSGVATTQREILTTDSGLTIADADLRYLTMASADLRYVTKLGDVMTGLLRFGNSRLGLLWANQALIYDEMPGAGGGLIIRRDVDNQEILVEDASGSLGTRTPIITERSGDVRYLRLAGGSLTGSLVVPTGSFLMVPYGSSGAPALMIGENSTGFWRVGNTVILSISGVSVVAQFSATGVQYGVPLNVSGMPITNVATPTSIGDAANKAYVDARRSNQRTYIPEEFTLETTARQFFDVSFPVDSNAARTILVTLHANFDGGAQGVAYEIGYTTNLVPSLEERVLVYRFTATSPAYMRALARFAATVVPVANAIRVTLSGRLLISGLAGALTQVGMTGGAARPDLRSYVTIEEMLN